MGNHWIVLVVGIIVASIGFMSHVFNRYETYERGIGLLLLAIFLAIVARIVQADIHNKQK
jgi:Mn2+/Fe2+ NRAMP family transporter